MPKSKTASESTLNQMVDKNIDLLMDVTQLAAIMGLRSGHVYNKKDGDSRTVFRIKFDKDTLYEEVPMDKLQFLYQLLSLVCDRNQHIFDAPVRYLNDRLTKTNDVPTSITNTHLLTRLCDKMNCPLTVAKVFGKDEHIFRMHRDHDDNFAFGEADLHFVTRIFNAIYMRNQRHFDEPTDMADNSSTKPDSSTST